ncbi:glycosyltransferase [Phototrophicus methaneseepsis]|uniref:Glycosyltransferase n=1 Tax=Phototrophicus methaneseepsis TaxID=2710758 RepID=A0A7S8EDN3_9CHLR|nr:glycosyltransferase [Phototrophicus methaneseepsis]QPC85037.1 glycosyltransferase [Phototrophicus methaneseepsis]
MKLALVHDWLNQVGGAEDVLATLVEMYPQSPIYTSIYAPDIMPDFYRQWDIRTQWLDHMPGIHRHHQPYLPLYPLAWGGLDLQGYDVILSNKSGFCHGLQFDPSQTVHVCYCLAPTRYVWQLDAYIAREGISKPIEMALRPVVNWLKRWDYEAAQRVTHFIAISTEIQERIRTYYDRDSVIIYPPVETARFQPVPESHVEDYFLIVSRLIPYKRIDLAVQAATRLGLPLKIGGKGRDMERLRAMAGPTVEFLGYVPDEDLPGLMARAKAFIFPGLEDFGITPVQAEAAGRPVIAYKGGGALDTVLPGITGEFFDEMTVDALADVMMDFDVSKYDPAVIRRHALQFDRNVFDEQIRAFVAQSWQAHQSGGPFIWQDPVNQDVSVI